MNKIFKPNVKEFNGIINHEKNPNNPNIAPSVESKYKKKEDGKPRPGVVGQYVKIIKRLSLKKQVVLDFGCSAAHAYPVFKDLAPYVTYVGADVCKRALTGARKMYDPEFLYRVKYNEPCLDKVIDNSIDLLIVSRLNDWRQVHNFFPEFNRVLKKGGHIFFWSNGGGLNGKKLDIYKYLEKDYNCKDLKKKSLDASRPEEVINLESFCSSLWGNKDRHKKLDGPFEGKEGKHRFRGLFVKK